jgi:hypothetical protein
LNIDLHSGLDFIRLAQFSVPADLGAVNGAKVFYSPGRQRCSNVQNRFYDRSMSVLPAGGNLLLGYTSLHGDAHLTSTARGVGCSVRSADRTPPGNPPWRTGGDR